MKKPLYKNIACNLEIINRCAESHPHAVDAAKDRNVHLVENFMPHGSGIDAGIKLLAEESNKNKIVFQFCFHHMNDGGFYDGWTEHKAIVTPSLQFDFDLKITGRDRNDVKEYLYEIISHALETECENQ